LQDPRSAKDLIPLQFVRNIISLSGCSSFSDWRERPRFT